MKQTIEVRADGSDLLTENGAARWAMTTLPRIIRHRKKGIIRAIPLRSGDTVTAWLYRKPDLATWMRKYVGFVRVDEE